MKTFNRTLNGFMAALFLYAAALQYIDANPFAWMSFYAAAALPCMLATQGRLVWPLPAIVGIIGVFWMAGLVTTGAFAFAPRDLLLQWHPAGLPADSPREQFGLVVVTIWMVFLTILSYRYRSSGEGAFDAGERGVAYPG